MENEKLFNFGNQEVPTEGKTKAKNLKFKILAIIVITLLLLIPKIMIQSLILEREHNAENAMEEVYNKWGREQLVIGPTITATHSWLYKDKNDEYEKRESSYRLLPNKLSYEGDIKTERRHRGIYEIVTYKGPLEIKGNFVLSQEEKKKFMEEMPDGVYTINFCVSELKGICDLVKIKLGDKEYTLEPDGKGMGRKTEQLSARIELGDWIEMQEIPFSMRFEMQGSQSLRFAPIGKNTTVHLTSDYETPSFCGNFLPIDSADSLTTKKGFDRKWSISYLNRNYPQFYNENKESHQSEITESAFGVNLLVPIGHYQKSMRCVKYAVLFIVLTLAVFFFIEMIHKKDIHPIQYALVGLALTLFYSLLLSFSEHIGFSPAYVVSTIMTVSLLTIYTAAVLKIKKTAFYIGGSLLLLYTYIFVLIQMESYALLAGSLGLFVILAFFMYLSQKIEWNGKEA